ncbi:unnamed protein product (macronuclear) [Paramecium tetraurelia]|uniref:Uncharacterized protein n=1 Tax=Paramecium tetraurelia TaxID=5888 RepID=A0CSX1_PARTE|nr:uncharacterized protein GSPATT00010161001 [Paramecium tetraurelia]CAK73888.1 unnamed protein product [Paramecium tetraurelia]|eukprot:XP_001441285.1 hypothetical protein (macronuclear) [Paramecium tetraurelia strain d4-2]
MDDPIAKEITPTKISDTEKRIIQYLEEELLLDQFTDPQLKQINFELSKKKTIFSFKSMDSDTEISEATSCSTIKSSKLHLCKSPLFRRRLSTLVLDQLS